MKSKQTLILTSLAIATSSTVVARLPAQADSAQLLSPGSLSGVLYDTSYGQIKIVFPEDMQSGDTLSGTIFLQPKGTSRSYENELNNYAIDIGGQQVLVRLPEFSVRLPSQTNRLRVALKNKRGQETASAELNVHPPAARDFPNDMCYTATHGQVGWPFLCEGPFDGDFGNTSAAIDGKDLLKMAESPRSLILECPEGVTGHRPLEIREQNRRYKTSISSIAVKVEAQPTTITRGESVPLTITAEGVYKLPSPVAIQLSNATPSIVQLEGGNEQVIEIPRNASPVWQTTRTLKGLQSGAFAVFAWVHSGKEDPSDEPQKTRRDVSGKVQSQTPPPNPAGRRGGDVDATPSAPPLSAAAAKVFGSWSSNWGPLTFQPKDGGGSGDVARITGKWQQSSSKTGVIEDGTFDARTGSLQFTYYQSWNSTRGTASFTLEGERLKGRYTQPGLSGSWTLSRN